MERKTFSVLAVVIAGFLTQSAQAATFDLLLESDADETTGSEVFLTTFNTFDDILTSNFTSSGFSQLDIGPNFSAAGLAYSGFPPDPAVVPLPASLPLTMGALGLLALSGVRRRRLVAK